MDPIMEDFPLVGDISIWVLSTLFLHLELDFPNTNSRIRYVDASLFERVAC